MSKHTPGPWFSSKYAFPIDEQDSAAYCEGWSIVDGSGYLIPMNSVECALTEDGMNEPEANASLIAAAPELLSVAKDFRQKLATYVNVYPGDKELRSLLSACDAAIAKAEGQS